MSKYIKLDDAIHNINLEVTGRKEYTGDMKANLFFALDDLPTIEVSEDAISRATALEIYSDLYWIDERMLKFKSELDKVYEKLRTAPSVVPTTEQSPKVGEWLLDGRCSECLVSPLTTHKNYCPNCGAKMKGTDDE